MRGTYCSQLLRDTYMSVLRESTVGEYKSHEVEKQTIENQE